MISRSLGPALLVLIVSMTSKVYAEGLKKAEDQRMSEVLGNLKMLFDSTKAHDRWPVFLRVFVTFMPSPECVDVISSACKSSKLLIVAGEIGDDEKSFLFLGPDANGWSLLSAKYDKNKREISMNFEEKVVRDLDNGEVVDSVVPREFVIPLNQFSIYPVN